MKYEKRDIESARVKCLIARETEKALCIGQGEKDQVWVPRSQCINIIKFGASKDYPNCKDATIDMPEWLAEEKGLDYE